MQRNVLHIIGDPSWGVQHMLYQLKKGKIFDELPQPEYVIFNFINEHTGRTKNWLYPL